MDVIQKYCADLYIKNYNDELAKLKTKKNREQISQKAAIRITFEKSLTKYPNVDPSKLWKAVYVAHLHRKSKIADYKTISAILSADNSWKKSSGHAFEELIPCMINNALSETGIEIHLQRDISRMIKKKMIANSPQDVKSIKTYLKKSTFDLFFTITKDGKKYIFGCMQTKTSIRDRVTRDREPSINAMNNNFWSIAVVLDGDFLALQKFRDMVNGGDSGFIGNGWHGLYALSVKSPEGRIYRLDPNLKILAEHAKTAAKFWNEKRQWMKPEWSQENAFDY